METSLVEEIATKSADLPVEQQREVLEFVEFKLHRPAPSKVVSAEALGKKLPFRSVRGILQGEFPNLEQDIAEMRREAWQNFPRELPNEEPQQ